MMRRVAEKAEWEWERRSQLQRLGIGGTGLASGWVSEMDKEIEFLVTTSRYLTEFVLRGLWSPCSGLIGSIGGGGGVGCGAERFRGGLGPVLEVGGVARAALLHVRGDREAGDGEAY
jgi:hypothetical protein